MIRILHKIPMPARVRLALSRVQMERAFRKDLDEVKASEDPDRAERLKWEFRHELDLQREEEDGYITRSLLKQARHLRVPIPRQSDSRGEDTEFWYAGNKTVGRYLTNEGVKRLREEIRSEMKARREARAHLTAWLAALTGLIGAITGFLAVLGDTNG